MAIPSFFRSDGWVKTTLGPAVSGALVYVVQQPANLPATQSPIPPSPLQPVFSDPNGLIPITQPIVTDGFGHYNFYVTAGTYTIAVYANNKLMNSYADQSFGLASGGASVVAGTGIAVTGNVISTALLAGAGITVVGALISSTIVQTQLQVNGANLSSQVKLNLNAGANITLTDAGSGQVNIVAAGGASFGSAGLGFIFSNYGTGYAWAPGGSPTFCINVSGGNTVNSVDVVQITLPFSITIRKLTTSVGIGSSGHAGMGIYDSNGNLLVSGVVSTTSSGIQTVAVTATTIGPGIFFMAITGDTTGASCDSGFGVSTASGSSGPTNVFNKNVVRTGVAANASSAGVLPATLGAISAWTFTSTTNIAGFLAEA